MAARCNDLPPICILLARFRQASLLFMKHFLPFSVAGLQVAGLLYGCQSQDVTLQSGSQTLTTVVNGERQDHNWTISPQLKPDRYTVECRKRRNKVAFVSDVDSATFVVRNRDTIRFNVLYNGDTALTEIVGDAQNVHFSETYIREHKGQLEVDVPEVHELVNIVVALTRIGQVDSNMVDMTTPYYREMMRHFQPFAGHAIVGEFNRHITGVLDQSSYGYYYGAKMNACGYKFTNRGQIINKEVIRHMGFGGSEDPVAQHAALLADFAQQSQFRQFYERHRPYYDSLITTYRQLNPIDKMQQWLEKKFAKSYSSYVVLFSPLVGGAHATTSFADNGFEQTFMFVCRAEYTSVYNKSINEMAQSRVVFTEIDHNFVNPVSAQKIPQINKALSNREKWAGVQTDMYGNAFAVFNEYMTWGLFSLYCLDHFPPEDAALFIPKMEHQMVSSRNFVQFSAFNQHLISLYQANPDISMEALFDKALAWCGDHN